MEITLFKIFVMTLYKRKVFIKQNEHLLRETEDWLFHRKNAHPVRAAWHRLSGPFLFFSGCRSRVAKARLKLDSTFTLNK